MILAALQYPFVACEQTYLIWLNIVYLLLILNTAFSTIQLLTALQRIELVVGIVGAI